MFVLNLELAAGSLDTADLMLSPYATRGRMQTSSLLHIDGCQAFWATDHARSARTSGENTERRVLARQELSRWDLDNGIEGPRVQMVT